MPHIALAARRVALSSLLVFACMDIHAMDEPPVLRELLDSGRTASGAPVRTIQGGVIGVGRSGTVTVRREIVPAEAVAISTDVGLLPDLKSVVSDLQETLDQLARACESRRGQLRFDPLAFSGRDSEVRRWIYRLEPQRAFGEHTCRSAEDKTLFKATVTPSEDAKSRLMQLGFTWIIRVTVLSGQQLAALDAMAEAREQRLKSFRSALATGHEVQVPPLVLGERHDGVDTSRPLCALVIDVKGLLVQVQVRGGLQFVPRESAFPRVGIETVPAELKFTSSPINREAACAP
jgi:hypothetical protein